MWTILKVFTEFVTVLLLFYVLVSWPRGMWDPSSSTRDQTHTPCIERQSLNHWTAREVPIFLISAFCLRPSTGVREPYSLPTRRSFCITVRDVSLPTAAPGLAADREGPLRGPRCPLTRVWLVTVIREGMENHIHVSQGFQHPQGEAHNLGGAPVRSVFQHPVQRTHEGTQDILPDGVSSPPNKAIHRVTTFPFLTKTTSMLFNKTQ